MKKIVSLLLSLSMLLSMVVLQVSAATEAGGNWNGGTQVAYNAEDPDGDGVLDNTEAYTVTVPAQLAPGTSGEVVLAGTWASDRMVTVTADEEVVLENSINPDNTKTLEITFATIEQIGDNEFAIEVKEDVSVADIEKAIFGIWGGVFEYQVEAADVAQDSEKNEYGFYYNVPYVGDTSSGSAFVFYDDGTLIEFKGTKILIRVQSDELITNNQFVSTYTCDGLTATSASGTVFTFDENGESFVHKDIVYTMDGIEHGVYFDDVYSNPDYGTYVFYSDETIIYTDADGEITDYTGYYADGWTGKQHCIGSYFISLDGETLFVGTKIFTRCPSIDDGGDSDTTIDPKDSLNDYSWTEIQTIANSDESLESYGIQIGETISDGTYTYVLVDDARNKAYGGLVFMFNASVDETGKITNKYAMNSNGKNHGGYANSEMFGHVKTIENSLPSTLLDIIKDVSVYYNDGWYEDDGSTRANGTNDPVTVKLFLPSVREVGFETTGYDWYADYEEFLNKECIPEDGTYDYNKAVFDWFKTNGSTNRTNISRNFDNNNSSSNWWLRSASGYDYNFFWYVLRSGHVDADDARSTSAVVPAFVIG